ncbi:MAG: hypothetical protein KF849_01610 [Rhizobiaceae bacterium]|nr:hypothetical protein [Rhizobiaceae bacterium]
MLLDGGERGGIAVTADAVRKLLVEGLASRRGTVLELTAEGRSRRRRDDATRDPFQSQHRTMDERQIELADARAVAAVNLDESPLTALARRHDRRGKALLGEAEVAAGERLRTDYTRGQIMPRMGANWQAAVASGRRDGGRGGMADLTDAALAARMRVEKALDAVGPELAGVLVDVCCFLKGLETVERERGWPVRSAKVLLRTALSALARHYCPPPPQRRPHSILHWGGEGYRPTMAGGDAAG